MQGKVYHYKIYKEKEEWTAFMRIVVGRKLKWIELWGKLGRMAVGESV